MNKDPKDNDLNDGADVNNQNPKKKSEKQTVPRRGSTLEGRVRALIQKKGYNAETNKIVLNNEFDVWGEDNEGKVIIAECKEYYQSGPATPSMVRNFFGKYYDVSRNYGEDIYAALFVSISGFTEAAQSLCSRLGINAIDMESLEILEKSDEDISSSTPTKEDQTIISLKKQKSKLQEEINRRRMLKKLSQKIDEYKRILQTKTMPGFLIPTSLSRTFWYTQSPEIPIVGLQGEFEDFVIPNFPFIDYIAYTVNTFLGLGQSIRYLPSDSLKMSEGIARIKEEKDDSPSLRNISGNSKPLLNKLVSVPVKTVDNNNIGKAWNH